MRFLFLVVIFYSLTTTTFSQLIDYTLIIENPNRNYFNININYDVQDEEYVDFVMPAWTPASYVIKDWSKNVINVHAKNDSDSILDCFKIDKQTWRVKVNQSKKIELSYQVYAYSLNNPYHAHIEKEFAYFNGAVIFMYIKGKKDIPCNLEFKYPENWDLHTSMQKKIGEDKYQSINYDEFIDSPAFLGLINKFSFNVAGKQHFVVYNGNNEVNKKQIDSDLSKMVKWFFNMFGELPYEHYTFFLRVSESGGGGIEHLNSNVSGITPKALLGDINDAAYYSNLLMLESHEYFHLFNVKRIRPAGLGPFDYTSEVYTKMLWVSEGFTSYYTNRPLSKAGILSEDKILESWSKYINRLINNTALFLKPVSQYSFDAWLRSEIPDYSFRTYYTKGALIALLLDIEMRKQSNHKNNMDGFFQHLYNEVYKNNKTFNLDSFYQHLFKYSEIDFSEFFNKYVTGIDQLPIEEYLNSIGLQLNVTSELPFIGIKINSKANNVVIVQYVYPNSPADKIKIGRGDHIISIDGETVTNENWKTILKSKKVNDTIDVKWNHNNVLTESEIKIKEKRITAYKITKMLDITAEQEQFLNKLLLPTN